MAKPSSKDFEVPKPEPPSLSTREVAKIAGLDHKTIVRYYHDGIFDGYRVGFGQTSGIRIYVTSLQKFMRDRRAK